MDVAWWCGLIGVLFAGWALSSYASNFSYRLPRKEYPFGRKPYCGECNALLQPKDLAPIFSFLLTDGKCRYCAAAIPLSYYLLELVYPLLFLSSYIKFGLGDMFLLVSFTASALAILAMMAWEDGYFSRAVLLAVALCGLYAKALVFDTLTDGLLSGFTLWMIALTINRFLSSKQEFDLRSLPVAVWLAAALGCWLSPLAAVPAGVLWLVIWLVISRFASVPNKNLTAPVWGFSVALLAAVFCYY